MDRDKTVADIDAVFLIRLFPNGLLLYVIEGLIMRTRSSGLIHESTFLYTNLGIIQKLLMIHILEVHTFPFAVCDLIFGHFRQFPILG